MTGFEFSKEFQVRIDKAYSKYVDPAKQKRLFKRALYSLAEQKWAGLETQKEYDELRSMVSTEVSISTTGNILPVSPILVESITKSGNTLLVKTINKHNLKDFGKFTLSGVQGISTVPAINGVHTVGAIVSDTSFEFNVSTVAGNYVPDTGVLVHDFMVEDYMHLFAIRCEFVEPVGITIAKVIDRKPCVINLSKVSDLRDHDKVSISGHDQNVLNGVFYVKHHGGKAYSLFYDELLTEPVSGALPSQNVSGFVSKVFKRYADPITSDRKISPLDKPSIMNPKYETADGAIKIYPLNIECKGVVIDYFSKPPRFIDPEDDTLDLENIYPVKFLYRVLSEAVVLYATPSRDQLLEAMERRETQTNN
jgi:hypothetical protein